MYTELIIRPKRVEDQIFYPDTARALVAEALDLKEGKWPASLNLLFNRDKEGKTIQGRFDRCLPDQPYSGIGLPPIVTFDGGKGFFRIYMFGEPGKEFMMLAAPIVAAAVAKHIGGPYAFDLKEGQCTLRMSPQPILYSIRRLVVTKAGKPFQHFVGVEPHAVIDQLKRILIRGLISQSRWLDLHGAKNIEHNLPEDDALGFHIFEGKSCPVTVKPGIFAASFAHLTFSMNLALSGPWMAGFLRSRGYGQIRKVILKGARS